MSNLAPMMNGPRECDRNFTAAQKAAIHKDHRMALIKRVATYRGYDHAACEATDAVYYAGCAGTEPADMVAYFEARDWAYECRRLGV